MGQIDSTTLYEQIISNEVYTVPYVSFTMPVTDSVFFMSLCRLLLWIIFTKIWADRAPSTNIFVVYFPHFSSLLSQLNISMTGRFNVNMQASSLKLYRHGGTDFPAPAPTTTTPQSTFVNAVQSTPLNAHTIMSCPRCNNLAMAANNMAIDSFLNAAECIFVLSTPLPWLRLTQWGLRPSQ